LKLRKAPLKRTFWWLGRKFNRLGGKMGAAQKAQAVGIFKTISTRVQKPSMGGERETTTN